MDWVAYALSIVAGLAVTIPLVFKLVEYVGKAVKEKNWPQLIDVVMDYMIAAEKKFATGAERKEWVMAMVEVAAKQLNYDVDMDVVSKMIDDLCAMSKKVNPSQAA